MDVAQSNASILIIDDDRELGEMLNSYFEVQGYQVATSNWGVDGLNTCLEDVPDIVLLDIRMPDLDGYEIARRLKNNRRTQTVPIIFLTEKRQREDRLRGLAMQVEDYITKPFDIQELRLRVRNVLMRYNRSTLSNIVSGLPEKQLLFESIESHLEGAPFGLVLVCLNGLEEYNNQHGFIAANELQRDFARLLNDNLVNNIEEPPFLAQWGNANFILITVAEQIDLITSRVRNEILAELNQLYPTGEYQPLPIDTQLDVQVFTKIIHPQTENLQGIINALGELIH